MRTLLCIGAVFALCGTACAEGTFDPFAGIKEGVLCGDAQEADPHQAQMDGNVVIDSPAVPSIIIDDDSSGGVIQDWLDNRRHLVDYVIPDICISVPALADCRNFRPMIRRPVPDAERQTVQGVNLVSPADVD